MEPIATFRVRVAEFATDPHTLDEACTGRVLQENGQLHGAGACVSPWPGMAEADHDLVCASAWQFRHPACIGVRLRNGLYLERVEA